MTGFTQESAVRVGKATLWVERNRTTEGGNFGRKSATGVWQIRVGKLNEELVYQGSAEMSWWVWNGSTAFEDSGIDFDVYDWLLSSGQTIASGIQVVVAFVGGVWVVIGAQCP